MFYRYYYDLSEISIDQISDRYLTVGFVNFEELKSIGERFGFAQSTIDSCENVSNEFRSGVEVHDDYTFTELKVINFDGENFEQDCVALYIKEKLLICVDVADKDGSTKEKFFRALKRYPINSVNLEKILAAFIEALTEGNNTGIERISNRLTEIEEQIFSDGSSGDFNKELLHIKKQLLALHNYYNQIVDITETLEENDNEILNEDRLIYVSNSTKKINRLREDVDTMSGNINHMQDALIAWIDQNMNRSMKVLTVVTTVFLPLTIIVGWYGMNFEIPELSWDFGYLYVIILSVCSIVFLLVIGKIKKWF